MKRRLTHQERSVLLSANLLVTSDVTKEDLRSNVWLSSACLLCPAIYRSIYTNPIHSLSMRCGGAASWTITTAAEVISLRSSDKYIVPIHLLRSMLRKSAFVRAAKPWAAEAITDRHSTATTHPFLWKIQSAVTTELLPDPPPPLPIYSTSNIIEPPTNDSVILIRRKCVRFRLIRSKSTNWIIYIWTIGRTQEWATNRIL